MLDLLPLFAGVILAQLAPGPNLVAVSGNALAGGRRAGIATAMAIALGNGVWAAGFSLGLGAALVRHPAALHWLSLFGGAYLVFMAFRGLSAALSARPTGTAPSPRRTVRGAFRHGLLINLTNPKAALLWASVTVYLAGLGLSPVGLFLAACGVVLSALLVYGSYALLFSTGPAMSGYARVSRGFEAAFGAIFGVLGAKLMADGVTGLRG